MADLLSASGPTTGQQFIDAIVRQVTLLVGELTTSRSLEPVSDTLILAIAYRLGPCTVTELHRATGYPTAKLQAGLDRLVKAGRMELNGQRYTAKSLIVPMGSSVGWEAGVFDHVRAVVQTLCERARAIDPVPGAYQHVGGSTYTCEIWSGHPLEDLVKGQLEAIRLDCHEVRKRVAEYNKQHGLKPRHQQVITYVGQCVLERNLDAHSDNEGDPPNA
ncbi:MAG TPA: hypothetical protein VHO25_01880 [Polyangiaceae bacterium]|nr:hypothetical protein [Polyangiaceae bacterium]